MFEFFRKHTWLLQVVLGFVVLAFVGSGIYQGYGSLVGEDNATVATVDGRRITRTEWDAARRQQIERVRAQMPNVDPKTFDTPEMKRQSLDGLVRERLMLAAADRLHLTTTDDRLQRLFASDPQLAFLRNPDGSVNRDALAAQGMSSQEFAQRLRQDLAMRQVSQGLTGTAVAPLSATSAALDAMFQQREVQVQRFEARDFAAKIEPTNAEIARYYQDPANAARFTASESESVEYVVLDRAALARDITVAESDVRGYYDTNIARYTAAEERRASHILVKVEPGATAADKVRAKAKAETLLAEVRKNPASFADVARKNSDDPGSAEKGGDLDFFGRGGLAAKPLEDAAFALKPDEVGGPVESEFGYHVVRLTAVRGGDRRGFESVKGEIETEIRNQLAQKRYTEAATAFTNMVYEQPESLKPAIDRWKLVPQTAQNVTRVPAPGATGALANPKLLEALFSADAVSKGRNTEAVEVAPSTLAAARVVKHQAARQRPLAEVRPQVRERLVAVQAAASARRLGAARLAELKASGDKAVPIATAAVTVSRAQPRDLPRQLIDAILQAPAKALPVYVATDLGEDGYAVAKVVKVLGRDAVVADAAKAQSQYSQVWADAESQAYDEALKKRLKVEIKAGAISAEEIADQDPANRK